MTCTPHVGDQTLLVLTFHPRFRRYAFRELRDLDADAAELSRLDVDSSLVSTTLGPRAQEA
ncbi:MAG TPA: hypothetical protein VND22_08280, partial [Actinomycetota bacterium]|nr:hypothetical protein [Actinomycetota bacterium]